MAIKEASEPQLRVFHPRMGGTRYGHVQILHRRFETTVQRQVPPQQRIGAVAWGRILRSSPIGWSAPSAEPREDSAGQGSGLTGHGAPVDGASRARQAGPGSRRCAPPDLRERVYLGFKDDGFDGLKREPGEGEKVRTDAGP